MQWPHPRIVKQRERFLWVSGREVCPGHEPHGVGREVGSLTQEPAGVSSDSGSNSDLIRDVSVSVKTIFGFIWDR